MSTLETFEASASLTTFFADLSDADLVARVQAGQPEYFAALYDRHVTAVTRVCSARLGQPDLVQEAVQETFARALESLPAFTGGARFGHWCKRVAKNACIDLLRQRARLPLGYDTEPQLADHQAETAFARCLDRQAVKAVLGRLDERDAAMLVAHHMAEEPLAATAQRWSTTPGSAAVMLHRARGKARRRARMEGFGLALAPFAPLRRLFRQLRDRLLGADGTIGTLLNVTTAQLVVSVVFAVPAIASAVATAAPPDPLPAPVPSLADTLESSAPAVNWSPPAPPASPGPSAAHPPATAESGADTSASAPPPPPPVPLPVVEVDAVDARVHQEAPRDPDYTYGVDPPLLVEERPGMVVKDEPMTEPADQAACAVAELGEPLTYCDQSPG